MANNTFLNTIARMQNVNMLDKSIAASRIANETAQIGRATKVVNETQKALSLVDDTLRNSDESVDMLNSSPALSKIGGSISDMSAKYTEMSNKVAKQKKAVNEVYNKSLMSLATIGGTEASNVARGYARQQGLTNQELDANLDKFRHQVEFEKSLVGLETSKTVLQRYKYEGKNREQLSAASNVILDNELYKSLPTIVLESASEEELTNHNRHIARIIDDVAKQTGIEKSVVEDALATMNSYTKKIQPKVNNKTTKAEYKKMEENPLWIDSYKTIQDASRVLDFAKRTPAVDGGVLEEGAETAYDMAKRIYKSGTDEGPIPESVKTVIDMFNPDSDYSIAVRQIKALDPWGTATEREAGDLFEEQVQGRMLPADITASIGNVRVANDERYRDLIMEGSMGGVLSGDVVFPTDEIAGITGNINKYFDDTKGGFGKADLPIDYSQPSNRLFSKYGRVQYAKDPKSEAEFNEIATYNEMVNAGLISRDVPLGERDLDAYFEAPIQYNEVSTQLQSDLTLDDRVIRPAAVRHFDKGYKSAIATTKEAVLHEPSMDFAAAESGVSKDIIRAVIAAESGFNPKAKSEKDAIGLGQLKIAAVKDVMTSIKKIYPSRKLTIKQIQEDPDLNILATGLYLEQIGDMVEGLGVEASMENVLHAYNAGIGNFKKYLAGDRVRSQESRQYPTKVQEWADYFNSLKRGKK